MALTAHVAHTYGGANLRRGTPKGGLAPGQERRVKDLMGANVKQEVLLSHLALECGLSVRHFSRAFRQSTGIPPHRWLLKRRIDHARELLNKPGFTLTDIALACGFADQSHFTAFLPRWLG